MLKRATDLVFLAELQGDDRKEAESWMSERIKDEDWLKATRKALVEGGYTEDKVAKYPPEQILFYHLQRQARIQNDESLKWINVPYWQAEAALEELGKASPDLERRLIRSTVFSVGKIRPAHVRLEQRLCLLRVVEAIRLDAAKNGGKLAEKLSDLTSPIPNDPATGKPFAYKLDGMTVTITGTQTKIVGGGTYLNAYEVRLRK